MIYLVVFLTLFCFILWMQNAKLHTDYANLSGELAEKDSKLLVLASFYLNNKNKLESNSATIDDKTAALIKLASSSTSECEARTAAFQACKRLSKNLK